MDSEHGPAAVTGTVEAHDETISHKLGLLNAFDTRNILDPRERVCGNGRDQHNAHCIGISVHVPASLEQPGEKTGENSGFLCILSHTVSRIGYLCIRDIIREHCIVSPDVLGSDGAGNMDGLFFIIDLNHLASLNKQVTIVLHFNHAYGHLCLQFSAACCLPCTPEIDIVSPGKAHAWDKLHETVSRRRGTESNVRL